MKHRKPLPSDELLKRLFAYNRRTGIVRWRVHLDHTSTYPGKVITSCTKNGYLRVQIYRSSYRLHLIIWKMVTGVDPVSEIDHRDLDRKNNRWRNLREATRSQNAANMGITSRNTSGFKGVSFYRPSGLWRATIRKDGRLHFLGDFDTPQEAHAAYVIKANELYGEYARMK